MSAETFIIVSLSLVLLIFWGIWHSQDNELKALRGYKSRGDARPDQERKLLDEGLNDSWMKQKSHDIARSAGYVVYLAWFLRTEKKYCDYRGIGENQYPPDWKWRKGFVLLRDSFKCRDCGIGVDEGLLFDCHHIVPISDYPLDKPGIHGIQNLLTLCAVCHAKKHLENIKLQDRAKKLQERAERWRKARSRLYPRGSRPRKWLSVQTINLEDLMRPAFDPSGIGEINRRATSAHEEETHWPALSPEQREQAISEFLRHQNFQASNRSEEAVEALKKADAERAEERLDRLADKYLKDLGPVHVIRDGGPTVQAFNEVMRKRKEEGGPDPPS